MLTEITDGGQANLDSMFHPTGDPADAFSPDFVDHDPAVGQPAGGAGLAWYWERFGTSFSDLDRTLVDTVATAEHVVTVMDLSGTHTGDFLGHAPTGKRFTVRNVQVMRIVDGKRVERWGSTDELGILQQLGLA
jgi:predicted ester cyclase